MNRFEYTPIVALATSAASSAADDARRRDHDEQYAAGRREADRDENEAGGGENEAGRAQQRPGDGSDYRRRPGGTVQRYCAVDDDIQDGGLRPDVTNARQARVLATSDPK